MVPLLAVTGVNHHRCYLDFPSLSLFLLPVQFLVMKSLTRNEPMRFNLIAVWLRAKGKPVANRLFGATTFMPVEHDDVDIKEFLDAMKLNQCATIKKLHPVLIAHSSACGSFPKSDPCTAPGN
ncbi:hypothetical protein LNP74_26995 [Klebsiella pneumoniae subsp. pneumoniae]|nr:hypothetical protein [Klebsiella pneumoniae subsp. pneumoniae]